ncbi:hypothetical protein LTS17_007253 [Exophiala oligosperma]
MARGSGKKRAHRSKRATKQFFNQGSQDGSASAPGEGESSTAQNPHPAPVPSSSSCLEHPHPTPCQSQTAHDETKPKAVILPRGYTFVTPLLHRAEKLQLITEYLWKRAEKDIISHYRTAPLKATEELVAQFAFAYSIKPPGWTTRVWRVDPEIIRRVARGLWKEGGLHNVFRANGTEGRGLEARDIVLTANKNQNLGDWEAAAYICNWFLYCAAEYEDREDIQRAGPTIIVGLINYTYICKFRAYCGDSPSFEDRTYWDWFRFDRRTRMMPARQNLLVPDAGKVKDHFEDGSFYPDLSDIESECEFEDCQAYITEEAEEGQGSSSAFVPPTTTTAAPPAPHHDDNAATAAGPAGAGAEVKGKGKAKATQYSYATLPGQGNVMSPTIGVDNPDVPLPLPTTTNVGTTNVGSTTSAIADTATATTTAGDNKKKKKRKNRKRKNKNKKKKNNKGIGKATDVVDGEEEEEEDASVIYYSANNCDNDDDEDDDEYGDEDNDDDDDGEGLDAREAQKKLPSLYEQIMSSYAEYSHKKAEESTVKAALEALEAHRESLARSRAAAAHEKLQRELMAVLERVKDKPARVRRAILAREHQRLLASETLAAARGAQNPRPTSSATRVEEEGEKSVEEEAAEAVVLAGAAAAAAAAPLRRPRFNLGTDPGWMGDLERMQIQVLRVGGRGGGRGGGAGEKKEEK